MSNPPENKTPAALAACGIFVRGFAMGIADLIPGVSGGTIAFISGIYVRLLAAVAVFSGVEVCGELLRLRVRAAWICALTMLSPPLPHFATCKRARGVIPKVQTPMR